MKAGRVHLRVVTDGGGPANDNEIRKPRTRADCVDGPRPCPWVTCRHHLAIDVDAWGGTLYAAPPLSQIGRKVDPAAFDRWAERVVDRIATMKETCALDVAARGSHTLEEIGDILGVSKEMVRVHEVGGLRRLRRAGGLGEFEDHEPPEHYSVIARFSEER